MWGMKKYYLGHICSADPLKLGKVMFNDTPCTHCAIAGLCGGRCLYANITKRWSPEAYANVCNTVKSLVKTVQSEMPRIKQLIKQGKLALSDFEYLKYNGCEIIP